MDEKWFKQQQRKAGVTAEDIAIRLGRDRSLVSRIYVGRQKMTLEQARIFAEVLGAPLSEILERAGVASSQVAQQITPGFSEGDATPFIQQGAEARKASTIAEAFGARPGVDVWQISSRSMTQAGYLPGDFMLVDTHQAERATAGDVVVAQVYSPRGAKTVLRRYFPPFLVAQTSPGEDEPPHVVDNSNVVIRGKVIASWRQ